MDYIDDKLKLAVCALLCCAFFLGFGTAAYAADSAALAAGESVGMRFNT